MRNTIIAAALFLAAGLVFFARRRRSLQPAPLAPTGEPEPAVRDEVRDRPKKKVSPPAWLKIMALPLLDLEMVLEWFQTNKSRVEGAPPTVVGFVLRVNKDRPSEAWQLGRDFLPEVELAHGNVLIGFYDRETKKLQKQFTVVLYRTERISVDLDEQFDKKDLLIIE